MVCSPATAQICHVDQPLLRVVDTLEINFGEVMKAAVNNIEKRAILSKEIRNPRKKRCAPTAPRAIRQ
jgi:hypothetical protein